MTLEINGVAAWLYSQLAGNATIAAGVGMHPDKQTLQIYEMEAPQGAVFPYIIFAYLDGLNRRGTGGRRVLVRMRYQIRVIGDGDSFGDIATIADAIDDTLNLNQLLDHPTVAGCSALRPLQSSSLINGERRNLLGAEYEIQAYVQGDVI